MANNSLERALILLDDAEKALHDIRLNTPVDYVDDPELSNEVTGQIRAVDIDKVQPAMDLMFDNLDPGDRETFNQKFSGVNRLLDYVSGQKNDGLLPQLQEAPWPPPEWAFEDAMRADAEGEGEEE